MKTAVSIVKTSRTKTSAPAELVNDKFVKISQVVATRISQEGPYSLEEFTYVDIGSINNEAKEIESPKTLLTSEAPSRAKQRLQAGDVVVSMTRPNLNAIGLIDQELATSIGSTGFDVLRANRALVNPSWLFYVVQTTKFIDAMCTLVQGALYPAVRSKDIRNFEVWLPSLPTQHHIVAEIEEKLSHLDAAQSALLRAQANLKRYRASLLMSCFHTNGNSLPKGWVYANLEDLCNVVRGGSPRPAGDSRYFGGAVPWITVGTVTSALGKYVDFASDGLTEAGKEKSRYIESETLLLTNSGATLGVPKITRIAGCINDGVAALLDVDEPLKSYLLHFLSSQTSALRNTNQGAAQPNLNTTIIKAIRVPLAPKSQLAQIVTEVESRLSVIDATEATLRTQLARAKRLRQSILQQAFSPEAA